MADLRDDTNFLNTASIAFQRDGKFVVVGGTVNPGPGASDIARVIDNGSLDMTFGVKGSISLGVGDARTATSLAVQPDGKFVIVGGASIGGVPSAFVARYGIDAQPDRGFGNGGFTTPVTGAVPSQFQAVALDADGRIVAAGFREGSPDELLLYRLWP